MGGSLKAGGCRRKERPLGMRTGSLGWATAKDATPKKARLPQACGQEASHPVFLSCPRPGPILLLQKELLIGSQGRIRFC